MTSAVVWNPSPKPFAKLRWVVFPHAGGLAANYRVLQKFLPADWELILIELPGRGRAMGLPKSQSWSDLSSQISRDLKIFLDRPCIFFGHSMGALVAYEVLLKLEMKLPALFVPSAMNSPASSEYLRGFEDIFSKPRDQLLERLKSANGIPVEVLENPRLLDFFIPDLRRDFQLLANYPKVIPPSKIDLPIVALIPSADPFCSSAGLESWREFTTENFKLRTLTGGHFYLFSNTSRLVEILQFESLCLS